MTNLQSAVETYRTNQINGASPLDLLIITYDVALASCGQQDLVRFTKALGVLRDALDYSYDAEIALGFFKLYQYCGDLARKGEFDEAADLIRELRDTWAQVREQYQTPTVATSSVSYGNAVGQMTPSPGLVLAG